MSSNENKKGTGKKKKSGVKRKKDNVSNDSYDRNVNKVQIVNSSQESTYLQDISNRVSYCAQSNIDNSFISMSHNLTQSTPVNMNYQQPNLSFNGSPITGYPPIHPSQVQLYHQSQGSPQMESINYGEKIDSLCCKLDNVFKKLEKLDVIEQRLCNFEKLINTVVEDVNSLKSKNGEIDSGMNFMNNQFEDNLKRTDELQISVDELVSENASTRDEIKKLNDKQIDMEARNMRDNLIFTGLQEDTEENPEVKLKHFIEIKTFY